MTTTPSNIADDIRRATEREFTVPVTDDRRPCLLIGTAIGLPTVTVAPIGAVPASGCFRPDYPTLFSPGDRVTVRTSDHGSNAYVYVVDASSTGRNRREMWWRKLG